jgi:hypothetical protein
MRFSRIAICNAFFVGPSEIWFRFWGLGFTKSLGFAYEAMILAKAAIYAAKAAT